MRWTRCREVDRWEGPDLPPCVPAPTLSSWALLLLDLSCSQLGVIYKVAALIGTAEPPRKRAVSNGTRAQQKSRAARWTAPACVEEERGERAKRGGGGGTQSTKSAREAVCSPRLALRLRKCVGAGAAMPAPAGGAAYQAGAARQSALCGVGGWGGKTGRTGGACRGLVRGRHQPGRREQGDERGTASAALSRRRCRLRGRRPPRRASASACAAPPAVQGGARAAIRIAASRARLQRHELGRAAPRWLCRAGPGARAPGAARRSAAAAPARPGCTTAGTPCRSRTLNRE